MVSHVAPHKESWGRLISTYLLTLAVIAIFLAVAITLEISLKVRQPAALVAITFVAVALGELAALGLLTWLLHRRGSSLRNLGLWRPTRWRAIALGIGIALVYGGYTAISNPAVGPHVLELSLLKLLALVVAVIAGFVEETITRGYVMTALEHMGHGRVVQVLLSGVTFALLHSGFAFSPFVLLLSLGYTFLLGIGLALTYLVGKRSLTPVIIGHILVDFIIEPGLFLSFFS